MKERESLADQAYKTVEEMIVTLRLAPGHIFSEAELSEAISIGRTPLREALQRLAADQLVTTMPRRGMRVTEVNIREMLTILETRRVLDRLLAGRAARRFDKSERIRLRILADDMDSAVNSNNLENFLRIDQEIDDWIAEAAGNPYAAQATRRLHSHCRRFWYANQASGDIRASASLHKDLVVAIQKGDEKAAEEASDAILDYLETFVRTPLESF